MTTNTIGTRDSNSLYQNALAAPGSGSVDNATTPSTLHSKTGNTPDATAKLINAALAHNLGQESASALVKQQIPEPQLSIRNNDVVGRARSRAAPNTNFILSARHMAAIDALNSKASNPTTNSVPANRARANAGPTGAAINKMRAMAVIRQEIRAIDLNQTSKNLIGSFLRTDSAGQRLIKSVISPEFEAPARQLVTDLCTSLQSSFKALGAKASPDDIDTALTKAYTMLIEGTCKITLPDSFKEFATAMASELDSYVKDSMVKATPDRQRIISEVGPELKKGISKALMLRVFLPHVSEFLRPGNADFNEQTTEVNNWLAEHPNSKLSGVSVQKFAAFLLTKLNDAGASKHNALGEHFPKLLKTFKESDLSGFSDLVALNKTLLNV